MGDQHIVIPFEPPRAVREAKASYFLEDGDGTLQLPQKFTSLERDTEGRVTSVTIPQWLAENEGLIGRAAQERSPVTYEDWCLLGLTIAFLIRGESDREAVWLARRVTDRLLLQNKE